jgi:hypothetical protein
MPPNPSLAAVAGLPAEGAFAEGAFAEGAFAEGAFADGAFADGALTASIKAEAIARGPSATACSASHLNTTTSILPTCSCKSL